MFQARPGDASREKLSQSKRRQCQFIAQYQDFRHSYVFGYIVSILLICILIVVELLNKYISPEIPYIVGFPYSLTAILVALVWGAGPALVALVLGMIVVFAFIVPGLLTTNILRDIVILGPFILLLVLTLAIVIRLERSHLNLYCVHKNLDATNQSILQMNQQLEQANALKDYVFTRAAHELRTPLTTILGRTQLISSRLQKTGETPENWAAVRKYIQVVKARANQQRALLESLLYLSRVQLEQVPLNLTPCDLESLCHDVLKEQQTPSEHLVEFSFPETPILIMADKNLLTPALTRLISNAMMYSPHNSVVTIGGYADEKHVVLYIHNDASALSPTQLAYLFEPFYRTSEVENASLPGWGLGLTITKGIIERHRGKVWAESSQDEGVTLFAQFPVMIYK
ncbi:sensor histidine kinase [Ktedonospora formicarum]|uniref:histidine kinase n=1 Tax=Ktedonospora formicarum TaxID=2778364 RepID=A0A8J3MTI0_9CHLR|nr:HAMP domain-containing sensor histidine kinase [Ktedonospora formicarum]GHO47155.1 hypothetical protein KSX_53180 [Ktedonospora formicarum]